MKLINLIECQKEMAEIEIAGVTCDSRVVKKGFAFVCISGSKCDGHDFAKAANEKGAAVIIAERDLGL